MKHDASAISRQNTRGNESSVAPSTAAAAGASASVVAEGILKAIQTGSRRNGGPSEVREATRFHYCVPMTLHIDDPKRAGTRVIRAATSNVSTGGFAFIFDAAVSPGSTVRAQFDSLPGKPEIAGVVRSCVYICGTQHRIGVEYH
jgi:hypothetical protein